MYLANLNASFKVLLFEYNGGNEDNVNDIQNYSPTKLLQEIEKEFGDTVIIRATNEPHNKRIIYRKNIDVEQYVNQTKERLEENSEQMDFENVAYKIRNEILMIKKKKLRWDYTASFFVKRQSETF